MTDCDLCGKGIPAVIPFRVFRPLLKFAYPEGVWKGLCETCLGSAEKTYLNAGKNETLCRRGKCSLCGRKGGVFLVELQIPSFSKGIVKRMPLFVQSAWNPSMRLISGTRENSLTSRIIYTGTSTFTNTEFR